MSYPEPRYLGEGVWSVPCTGQRTRNLISAHRRATRTTSPPTFSPVTSSGCTRSTWHRGLPGRAPHRSISESFFVLAGEVQLFDGERWITARRDDFLYVPVGGLHAFRNGSDAPASMLLLFSPGAPREEYFENVAEMARRGGDEFAEFLVRHDSFFVDVQSKPPT